MIYVTPKNCEGSIWYDDSGLARTQCVINLLYIEITFSQFLLTCNVLINFLYYECNIWVINILKGYSVHNYPCTL